RRHCRCTSDRRGRLSAAWRLRPAPSIPNRRSGHRCAATCDAPTAAEPSVRGSWRACGWHDANAGHSCSYRLASLLLRFLQLDLLAGIAHALALVGLRRAEATDIGSHLADALHIGALD